MTLQELIQEFRVQSGDKAYPPLWSDEVVTQWLNEAVNEAAMRGRLLHEDSNPDVCRIPLTPGQHSYALHPAVVEIRHLELLQANGGKRLMKLRSLEWVNSNEPDWRGRERESRWVIQHDTGIRVVGEIVAGDVLTLECYRLPLVAMADGADVPELHRQHHRHLVNWAMVQALGIVDADGYNLGRAKTAEDAFTDYFGQPVSSDLRRYVRDDEVPHIQAHY